MADQAAFVVLYPGEETRLERATYHRGPAAQPGTRNGVFRAKLLRRVGEEEEFDLEVGADAVA